jgi:hypothetical protein
VYRRYGSEFYNALRNLDGGRLGVHLSYRKSLSKYDWIFLARLLTNQLPSSACVRNEEGNYAADRGFCLAGY